VKFSFPLSADESSRLYWELARRGAYAQGEKRAWRYDGLPEEDFHALAVLQARYDPRLMAILTDYFRNPRPSKPLDPLRFKRLLRDAGALAVVAVIGEYVLESLPPDSPPEARDLFEFLRVGVSPEPTQLFYRGLYPLGGVKIQEMPEKQRRGYDRDARLRILREFAGGKKEFRLRDYLREIRFSVSRQQALQDLASVSWIRKKGRGKGAVYVAS
jgi:hypothetical protein